MARSRSRVYVGARSLSSPWLAVNLSAVMPGWGQMYSGAWGKGGGIAIATLLLVVWIAHGLFMPAGETLRGLLLLLLLVGLYFGNLWDSHRTAMATAAAPIRQDPWYPVFLSHVLPGMGQFYLQMSGWGAALLLVGVTVGFLANLHPTLLPVPPLLWAVGCGHAYINATPHRRWAILAAFLVLLMVIRLTVSSIPVVVRFAVEQCIVPSRSMLPTLQVNDRILVNKLGAYQPQLQDVIVFQAPPEAVAMQQLRDDDLVVKRIVGLPGQRVAVRNGQVWINGAPLAESYLAAPPNYRWGPDRVPDAQLFVLGDNRNQSSDSHVWGFLPQDLVLGKAYKIYWPPSRVQPL